MHKCNLGLYLHQALTHCPPQHVGATALLASISATQGQPSSSFLSSPLRSAPTSAAHIPGAQLGRLPPPEDEEEEKYPLSPRRTWTTLSSSDQETPATRSEERLLRRMNAYQQRADEDYYPHSSTETSSSSESSSTTTPSPHNPVCCNRTMDDIIFIRGDAACVDSNGHSVICHTPITQTHRCEELIALHPRAKPCTLSRGLVASNINNRHGRCAGCKCPIQDHKVTITLTTRLPQVPTFNQNSSASPSGGGNGSGGGGGNKGNGNSVPITPPSPQRRIPPPPPTPPSDDRAATECDHPYERYPVISGGRFPERMPNFICEDCQKPARLHKHGPLCVLTREQAKARSCETRTELAAMCRAMLSCAECYHPWDSHKADNVAYNTLTEARNAHISGSSGYSSSGGYSSSTSSTSSRGSGSESSPEGTAPSRPAPLPNLHTNTSAPAPGADGISPATLAATLAALTPNSAAYARQIGITAPTSLAPAVHPVPGQSFRISDFAIFDP